MFSPKVEKAMNEQIKRELDSAYIYASMAAYFDRIGLPGAAHWMKAQFGEEQEHAWKFYGFIYDRGGNVTFEALDKPPADYASPLDAFEQTLAHERKVTGHIEDLYALAEEEKDYASQILLSGSSRSRWKKRRAPATSSTGSAASPATSTRSSCWTGTWRNVASPCYVNWHREQS